jgi:hypothetical protein
MTREHLVGEIVEEVVGNAKLLLHNYHPLSLKQNQLPQMAHEMIDEMARAAHARVDAMLAATNKNLDILI